MAEEREEGPSQWHAALGLLCLTMPYHAFQVIVVKAVEMI